MKCSFRFSDFLVWNTSSSIKYVFFYWNQERRRKTSTLELHEIYVVFRFKKKWAEKCGKINVKMLLHFITVIRIVYIWFLMRQKVNWTLSIALKFKFNTNLSANTHWTLSSLTAVCCNCISSILSDNVYAYYDDGSSWEIVIYLKLWSNLIL